MKNFLLKKISKYYFLSKIAAEARNPINISQAMEWLEISPSDNLNLDLIRKKYKKIVFENHPDKAVDKEAAGIKLIEARYAKEMLEAYLESGKAEETYSPPPPPRKEDYQKPAEENPFADIDRERRAARERERAERERAERERSWVREEPYFRVGIDQVVWVLKNLPGKPERFLGIVKNINHIKGRVVVEYPTSDHFGLSIEGTEQCIVDMSEVIPFSEGERVLFQRSSGKSEFAKAYLMPFDRWKLKLRWQNENQTNLTREIYFDKIQKVFR